MAFRKVDGVRVELTPEEEAARLLEEQDFDTNVKPTLIREREYLESIRNASGNLSGSERDVLVAIYNEVERWKMDNTASTPLLNAFAAEFPSLTKLQVGTKVIQKVQPYLIAASQALAVKIKGDDG